MQNVRCWYFRAFEHLYPNDWFVPIAAAHQNVLAIRYCSIAGLHEECSPATLLTHAIKRGIAAPLKQALCGTFVSLGLPDISRKTDAHFSSSVSTSNPERSLDLQTMVLRECYASFWQYHIIAFSLNGLFCSIRW